MKRVRECMARPKANGIPSGVSINEINFQYFISQQKQQKHTRIESHAPLTLEKKVDGRLLCFELATNVIDVFQGTDISPDEFEITLWIETLAFCNDAIGSFLRTAD